MVARKFSNGKKKTCFSCSRFKDGERIYPFGRYQISQRPDGTVELIVSQTIPADAGCYRCVAENDLGSDRTIADVNVECK